MLRVVRYIILFTFFYLFDVALGGMVLSKGTTATHSEQVMPTIHITNGLSDFEAYASLDASIERFMRKWHITGASVAIARNGKLLYAKGFGYSNLEEQEVMQPYNLLRVASISKLITAVAVMKLVDDGKLSLNQKVFGRKGILNDSYYSNYFDVRVEEITVRHLMEHSAGWTTRWGDHLFMPESIARQSGKELPLSKDDIIQFALSKRLHFDPGKRSSYNNLGYVILERVIEGASGRPYESYVREVIFEPIGVVDAFIAHNYDSLRYPYETRYYEIPDSKPIPAFDGQPLLVMKCRGGNDVRTLGAAGGWVISSLSLIKFLLSIDEDSDETIISKKSIRALSQREPEKHPLGWRWVSIDGSKWRTGSFAGTSALAIDQSDGFTFVFLSNTSPWIGARFPYQVKSMMSEAMRRVSLWPQVDLFQPGSVARLKGKALFFPSRSILSWQNDEGLSSDSLVSLY